MTRNVYHYQLRKCKKSIELIRKNKLLDACINGNGDIFKEIRKIRKEKNIIAQTIDGCDNAGEQFKNVYQKLYNSENDGNLVDEILNEVDNSIDSSSLDEVGKVTPGIVHTAVQHIKMHKNDPTFSFNSDCLKRAPSTLFYHLSNIIKCFLIHGHISNILLLATLVPIIKDKLGDAEASDNYRSIALSSIILKVFDWIVLLLFGKSLGLDYLQLSYQKECGTAMCSWLVIESVSYFLRNNTDVFSCFMDMKKAFDKVRHSTLFQKLLGRSLSPIFIRLLIMMYKCQVANVRWDSKLSDVFRITHPFRNDFKIKKKYACLVSIF